MSDKHLGASAVTNSCVLGVHSGTGAMVREHTQNLTILDGPDDLVVGVRLFGKADVE